MSRAGGSGNRTGSREWHRVLGFWFPEGRAPEIDADAHRDHWRWRMRGGADDAIVARFADLTMTAAAGGLDHWAVDPEGRLALIILLDQFPRSLWRDEPRAFAQDEAALSLAVEGLANGHYSVLGPPWFRIVFGLPLGHCEGPDHLDRLDLLIRLREAVAAEAPPGLRPLYRSLVQQAREVREVIAAFGRHPHRNRILGRASTPAEDAYLSAGRFPHLRAFEG